MASPAVSTRLASAFVDSARRVIARRIAVLTAAALALVAAALRAFRLDVSWDIFVDEITYLRLGEGVANELHVRLYGEPFYLHPPGYFFLEAGWMRVFPLSGDLIQQVYDLRMLNVVLAAASAAAVFGVTRLVVGTAPAVAAGLVFALDPFVIRSNSRVYIETALMLWVLLGFLVLLSGVGRGGGLSRARALAVGALFGCALLTKDMAAFLTLLPLAILFAGNWVLERARAVLVATVALAVYAVYPLTVAAIGDWGSFTDEKLQGVRRLLGTVQETGFNRENGPSFVGAVLENLDTLGTTYALLALGAAAVPVLLRLGDARMRVVGVLTACSYALILWSIARGTNEEQFFYLVAVPALIATVCGATLLLRAAGRETARFRVLAAVASVAGVGFVGWSGVIWYETHTEPDNGFERMRSYLVREVPRGTPVAATTDTAEFLLRGFASGPWGSIPALCRNRAEYVIISSYQATEGYGSSTPAFYRWVRANAQLAFGFEGRSFGLLGLYRLPARYCPAQGAGAAA